MDEDFINNTIEPELPNTIVMSGCINRNFCSSFLFLFPALYGYYINYTAIIIGSIICLCTSTAHHYYQAKHKTLQIIDRICVNIIALFFISHCLLKFGCMLYANLMYICSFITFILFVYIHCSNIEIYEKYYFFVHIFAVSGIMFYIKVYGDQLTNCTGD